MSYKAGIERLDAEIQKADEERRVVCKPFDFDSPIPPRKLIEINGCKSYAIGFLSVTGAAGGTGKSSLAIVEELSLATGIDLFRSDRPALRCGRKRVWSMSLEDDETEHRRRVLAAMRHYGLTQQDVSDHYLVTYKADSPIELARIDRQNGFLVSPQLEEIKATIAREGIDVINVDPFVNTHCVPENDNGAMNKVADLWRSIAQECGVAVGLTHHFRKTGTSAEISADDLRGAVSLVSAARLVRILAPMSREEAQAFGIADDRRRFYFWVNPSGKSNITPPACGRVWYEMASINLSNGTSQWDDDSVGVTQTWAPPDSLQGVTVRHLQSLIDRLQGASDDFILEHCRESVQSRSWIGIMVAAIVGLDTEDSEDKTRLKRIIKEWERVRVLERVSLKAADRKIKPCFRLGKAAILDSTDL